MANVNGHIESTYHKTTGEWTALKFISDPYIRIHGLAPGLNYGQQAFRMPGDDGGIALFRPDRNGIRLQHSSVVLNLASVPVDMLVRAFRAAVALNADYVPPTRAVGAFTAGRCYSHQVTKVTKVNRAIGTSLVWVHGVKPSSLGAGADGGEDYKDGDNVALIVPNSPSAIDSKTSDSVQHIARRWGWKIENRAVRYIELPAFSDVLGVGTAVGLVPIRSITRRDKIGRLTPGLRLRAESDKDETVVHIPDGQQDGGPVFQKLLAQLRAIQLGKVQDEFSRRVEV